MPPLTYTVRRPVTPDSEALGEDVITAAVERAIQYEAPNPDPMPRRKEQP